MPAPDQFWLKVLTDFVSQAIAALAGAVAGAGPAFRYARKRAEEDRAVQERDREALAGNVAMFTLIRMYRALLSFYRRRVLPWGNNPLSADPDAWYQMPIGGELALQDLSFDFNALAFLLKSKGEQPFLVRLDEQVELFRRLVDTIKRRTELLEREVQARLDEAQQTRGIAPTELGRQLEGILGSRTVETIKQYSDDIRRIAFKSLYELPPLAGELYKLLKKFLPAETFISFPEPEAFEQKPWFDDWPFKDLPRIP